ncbi:MAG: hypothetical protein ABW321_20645 [Polyangiales bacterium]
MSRVHAVSTFVLLLGAHFHAGAQSDGVPPINTTRSISAGADDDIITSGDVQGRGDEPGHAAGTYAGVAPGSASSRPPPAAKAAKARGATTITWPGFQMRPDGSSRVFIQSTAPLEPQPTAANGRYQLLLPGARIAADTNRLPLDTRFFNTPVTKVSLSAHARGATLQLDLRAEVTPQLSSERSDKGYYFTYIDLPKGSYGPAPRVVGQAAEQAPPAPESASRQAAPASRALRVKREGRIKLHD